MLDGLLDFIAPHYCCGCGQTGSLLCDYCKYDITNDPFGGCIVCGAVTRGGICRAHGGAYSRAWVVAERSGSLKAVLDKMKFEFARAGAREAGRLLDEIMPDVPKDILVVPMPTIQPHIRERGYDHTLVIAKEFARRRNLTLNRSLIRKTATKQLGSSRRQRMAQAEQAFGINTKTFIENRTYLVIDDIVTTGATAQFSSQTLLDAGAADIWFAAIARQPLDAHAKN